MATNSIKTTPLINILAKEFKCTGNFLQEKINHPMAMTKIMKITTGKKMQTTYMDRNGKKKIVKCARLSIQTASELPAYEGYLGSKSVLSLLYIYYINIKFLVTVRQHYYCRHRIRLVYPHMKCIVEEHNKGHQKYYPIELLELVEEDENVSSGWTSSEKDDDSSVSKDSESF